MADNTNNADIAGVTIKLVPYTDTWSPEDKDANFKADVSLHGKVDPLKTIAGLSKATNIPTGALVHYVLARWASEGASGLLELGPTLTRRLQTIFETAETQNSDTARLDAYNQVRQIVSWLNHPLDNPEVYE
jgi:hypothetical protein